jgi:endonuclease I
MSDLNILFSADELANGQRSNHPFGEVTGAVSWTSPAQPGSTERSRLGVGANGQLVFEPRDSKKGDIARAILYFYTRYSPTEDRTASFSLDNYAIEKPILVKWSTDDPPDTFERARNNLVFRAQGNRNPFIDRPDWAGIIVGLP